MKKLLTLLLLGSAAYVSAQTQATVIDFEDGSFNLTGSCPVPYQQIEGQMVDNNYFNCSYGVQFFSDAPGRINNFNMSPNMPQPFVVEVGGVNTWDPIARQWIQPQFRGFAIKNTNGLPFTTSNGCTIPDEDLDMNGVMQPTAYDAPIGDYGCKFLTATSNANVSLYVQYAAQNNAASGVLMDVDINGSNSEEWTIIAIQDGFGAVGSVVVSATNPNLPGVGDRGAVTWSIGPNETQNRPFDLIEFRYTGTGGAGVAFDQFSPFTAEGALSTSCCEDAEELIVNGGMENGGPPNLTVNGYSYQSNVGLHSVLPGEYTIVNASQASTISSTWDLQNASNCGDGSVLIVNGKTCDGYDYYPSNVIELRDIEVEEGETYSFCFSYQHLRQCSFDFFTDDLVMGGVDGLGPLDEFDCGVDSECNWTRRRYKFVAPGPTITLYITMAEIMPGDGNDIAFDDISLNRLDDVDNSLVDFTLPWYTTGTTGVYKVNGLAANSSAGSGLTVSWKIDEVDCNSTSTTLNSTGKISGWDPDNTWFNGYNIGTIPNGSIGEFYAGECYKYTRYVDGCCVKETSVTHMLGFNTSSNRERGGEKIVPMIMYDGTDEWVELPMGNGIIDNPVNDAEIYPNPGQGIVNVRTSLSIRGGVIQVFNGAGELVQRIDNVENDNLNSIDLSAENAGVYLISIMDAQGNLTSQTYIKE